MDTSIGEIMQGFTLIEVGVVVLLLLIFAIAIGGRIVEYTLEYWIGVAYGRPVDVSYRLSCILAPFVGWNICIIGAIAARIHSTINTYPPVAK